MYIGRERDTHTHIYIYIYMHVYVCIYIYILLYSNDINSNSRVARALADRRLLPCRQAPTSNARANRTRVQANSFVS